MGGTYGHVCVDAWASVWVCLAGGGRRFTRYTGVSGSDPVVCVIDLLTTQKVNAKVPHRMFDFDGRAGKELRGGAFNRPSAAPLELPWEA